MSKDIGVVYPTSSTLEWKITDFSSYADIEKGKTIDSPIFKTFCQDAKNSNVTVVLQWRLGVYPNGHGISNTVKSKFVSLRLESCNKFEIETKFSLEIVGAESQNNITKSNSEGKSFKPKRPSWGWEFAHKAIVLSSTAGFLIDDTLTVSCRIFGTKIMDTMIDVSGESSKAPDGSKYVRFTV